MLNNRFSFGTFNFNGITMPKISGITTSKFRGVTAPKNIYNSPISVTKELSKLLL